MQRIFKVMNVKCGGCANTLKKALLEDFGEVSVDLEKEPREISVEISEEKVLDLRHRLKSLGYPMSDEDLSTIESFTSTAKSFVSCAIGKIDARDN
ncbi:Heavy metal transport/detoxification protein [hydrothermal vent metagenome]|uniref:Heavy metal transport/detoxification protein n=1 Tax=hydrothermal vent metagenome TaxID=652676 RepID=A0A1W1CSA6_9ZZZZ